MKKFHREITFPCMVLVIGLMAAFTILGGCSVEHSHKTSTLVKKTTSQPRCKKLGFTKGRWANVAVRRCMFEKRVTEVTIWLHGVNPNDTKENQLKAASMGIKESTVMMIRILGFKPKLAAMSISRIYGRPCYVFFVIGVMTE